jgi:hypothetical protein
MIRIPRLAARAALVTAATIGALLVSTVPVAAAPASGVASQRAARGASGTWHGCPHEYLCVHYYTIGYYGERDYHWANFYDCTVEYFGDRHATWYVNNQTDGTRADFWYPNVSSTADLDFLTPPAKSRGRIPTRWDMETNRYEPPHAVQVC